MNEQNLVLAVMCALAALTTGWAFFRGWAECRRRPVVGIVQVQIATIVVAVATIIFAVMAAWFVK